MSKTSQNSQNKPQSLPLHELLSRLLESEKMSHRHPLPIMGTMQDLNQKLERQTLLDFLNASLRGVGQVGFANNPISGLLITLAIFLQSPWVALMLVLGVMVATGIVIVFNKEKKMVNSQTRPMIIDTDGGVDDALAIIMALNCEQIDLKAVTVLAGNIDVHQAANNALRVIDIVQPQQHPLVAKGCEKPLVRPPFNAAGIHGADGLGELHQFKNADGSPRYPQLTVEPSSEDAVDVLLKAAQEYGSDLTIVALGPLTNIATALQRDRTTMQKVGQITIMGGAVKVPGNISVAAEFNFFVDPDAAQMVMESGIPLTLVGLDVAMKAPLPRKDVEDYAQKHPSAVTQFIADCTGIYMAFYRDNEGFYGCYLHDPLALGVAIDPSLVSTESVYMVVETEGKFTSGMSMADLRDRRDESAFPPNVEACLDVDTERFLKLFYELI